MSNDPVNHPEHYETNGIECIDAMIASQGKEVVSNYCVCNAFKYIWRHQHKGKSVEDIQKAVWYLNRYLNLCEQKDEPKTTEKKVKSADLDYIIESIKRSPYFQGDTRWAWLMWLNDHDGAIEHLSDRWPLYIIDFDLTESQK